MSDQVVLVDNDDNKIGLLEKLAAHRGRGTLHRAVSVLLYRKKHGKTEVLLQQRSYNKPLWPLFWSNTVCTHPRDGEAPVDCAERRLQEEMGIRLLSKDLKFVFTFLYQARYNADFSEHELDHVFVGEWDGEFSLNKNEINDAKWMEHGALIDEIKQKKSIYTPWLMLIIKDTRLTERI